MGEGMDAYFQELGRAVLARWKRENFSLEAFPAIAVEALAAQPPADRVDLSALARDFLLNDEQAPQTHSGFGQPELVAYDHPRFYIQILFWLDGTTDIHQHEFSGAFHVMAGSSIHAQYEFENARSITPHFRVGDVRMREIELLETGRTVPIVSGRGCIHSLFHLDMPSVTVVVRTQHDPGTGPQFNYLPPHVALDPVFNDTLTMRRKQLLDVLEQTGDAAYAPLVLEMIAELDFERGFFVLQHCLGPLRALGEWESTLAAFGHKHGALASGIGATLEEAVRRDVVKELRSTITEPEHRFFLALLMNVPARAEFLDLVARRFPDEAAVDTVMRWMEELAEVTDEGLAFLDASFPFAVEDGIDEQAGLVLAVLRHFLLGGGAGEFDEAGLPADEAAWVHSVFAGSCLRPLVGPPVGGA